MKRKDVKHHLPSTHSLSITIVSLILLTFFTFTLQKSPILKMQVEIVSERVSE